jgi:hypothetical protein
MSYKLFFITQEGTKFDIFALISSKTLISYGGIATTLKAIQKKIVQQIYPANQSGHEKHGEVGKFQENQQEGE